MAVGSERGVVGLVSLGLVVVGLLLAAHRAVWGAAPRGVLGEEQDAAARALAGGALGGVLAATLVAGAFDAVLLLAAPTMVVWPALGALSALASGPLAGGRGTARVGASPGVGEVPRRRVALAAGGRIGAVGLALGAVLAVGHAAAMPLYEDGGAAGARLAARLAPGDYRIRLRAATVALGRGDCVDARTDAEAAHAIAPAAGAPRRVLAACGRRRGR